MPDLWALALQREKEKSIKEGCGSGVIGNHGGGGVGDAPSVSACEGIPVLDRDTALTATTDSTDDTGGSERAMLRVTSFLHGKHGVWDAYLSADKQLFYYNTVTGTTRWEPPSQEEDGEEQGGLSLLEPLRLVRY